MEHGPARGVSVPSPAGTVPKTNATRLPDEAWEAQKDTLHKLYIDENRTLNDIIDYMQNDQGFHAGKRQYVHRFQKWGWKKYGNSTAERSIQAVHSSGREEEDEDEGDEPGPAPQELVPEFGTQRAPTAARDETQPENSTTLVSSSSHDHRTLAPQHRDYFPRPLTLQEKAPVPRRAKRGLSAADWAQVHHLVISRQRSKATGRDSQVFLSGLTPSVRKSTEHDTGEDMEEEEEQRQPKKLKTDRTNRNFACPFRKRNPQRFNVRDHGSCALNSFSDFPLLKRHIKTFHPSRHSSLSCVRCKERFADRAALNAHLTQPEICSLEMPVRADDPEDGITEEVYEALTKRAKSANISSWPALWSCLFPEDQPDMIPEPDFEPVTESHQLEDYLLGRTRDLAQVLRSDMHAHGLSIDSSVDIERFLGQALLRAVHDFRQANFQEVSKFWRKKMDTYSFNFSEDRYNHVANTGPEFAQAFFE